MIKLKIIALGKLKEKYLRDAADEYIKRLKGYCDLEIIELNPVKLPDNPSEKEISSALKTEAQMIIKKIPSNSKIVSLCVEGKKISSEKFAETLNSFSFEGCTVCFLIGSSYGLCEEIKKMSNMRMSMSDMTFPHQLFRIMLLEQIYRAFKINEGSAYHK